MTGAVRNRRPSIFLEGEGRIQNCQPHKPQERVGREGAATSEDTLQCVLLKSIYKFYPLVMFCTFCSSQEISFRVKRFHRAD